MVIESRHFCVKKGDVFGSGLASSDCRFQEVAELGRRIGPSGLATTLASVGGIAIGRVDDDCRSSGLAGRRECAGSDLAQAARENETRPSSPDERAVAQSLDYGDLIYL